MRHKEEVLHYACREILLDQQLDVLDTIYEAKGLKFAKRGFPLRETIELVRVWGLDTEHNA